MKSVYKAGAANRESRTYRSEGLTDSGLAKLKHVAIKDSQQYID